MYRVDDGRAPLKKKIPLRDKLVRILCQDVIMCVYVDGLMKLRVEREMKRDLG